jgi:hypothetical protein
MRFAPFYVTAPLTFANRPFNLTFTIDRRFGPEHSTFSEVRTGHQWAVPGSSLYVSAVRPRHFCRST